MGTFEDLVQLARDGDTEALDTLEKEFSGSNLRDQQEAATKALKENEPFVRQGKFQALREELGEVDLSLEDLEGVDTDDFTDDLLREKVEEKLTKQADRQMASAKEAGFDSVEEYGKALEALKSEQAKKKEDMEVLGGATASTSGGQPLPVTEKDPYEEALEEFEGSTKGGATHDVALGDAAHAMMARQHPEPEKPS